MPDYSRDILENNDKMQIFRISDKKFDSCLCAKRGCGEPVERVGVLHDYPVPFKRQDINSRSTASISPARLVQGRAYYHAVPGFSAARLINADECLRYGQYRK